MDIPLAQNNKWGHWSNSWTTFICLFYLFNGKGPYVTRFVEFLAFRDNTTKSMYEVVTGLLVNVHWMSLNQVALATDGAFSMTGHCMGLVARICAKVSNL